MAVQMTQWLQHRIASMSKVRDSPVCSNLSMMHDLTKFSWKTSDTRTFVHPEHTVAEGRAAESRVAERSSILRCPALQQVAAALASTSQSH